MTLLHINPGLNASCSYSTVYGGARSHSIQLIMTFLSFINLRVMPFQTHMAFFLPCKNTNEEFLKNALNIK